MFHSRLSDPFYLPDPANWRMSEVLDTEISSTYKCSDVMDSFGIIIPRPFHVVLESRYECQDFPIYVQCGLIIIRETKCARDQWIYA